jgi:hypothetical protein
MRREQGVALTTAYRIQRSQLKGLADVKILTIFCAFACSPIKI